MPQLKHILFYLLPLLFIIVSCNNNAPVAEISKADTNAFSDGAPKTVINFLSWYKQNYKALNIDMTKGGNYGDNDTLNFISVNLDSTKKYLQIVKSSGLVSEGYLEKWRNYFKEWDEIYKKEPSTDTPPAGFNYDFIMCSQMLFIGDIDVNKIKLVENKESNQQSFITIEFETTDRLYYWLTNKNNHWLIDSVSSYVKDK